MSENSKIEWTDHTFNSWEGCQKIGPGCDNCYAETRNARFAGGTAINWGPGAPRRRTSASNWHKPVAWNAAHDTFYAAHGRRQRVFCASLADVFDNAVDPKWRADLFDLILATPNLDWLLLTKRIGNVARMAPMFWLTPGNWPANVWIGATIVNQEEADRDIPKLLAVPAAKHFLSMEPLLAPVDLINIDDGAAHREVPRYLWTSLDSEENPPAVGLNALTGERWVRFGESYDRVAGLDWVIVGGETGPGARPMHPDWARSLRDQCQAAGVPFLFKQWGEWAPHEAVPGGDEGGDLRRGHVRYIQGVEREPDGRFIRGDAAVARVGKKAAGRLLDGREWNEVPA